MEQSNISIQELIKAMNIKVTPRNAIYIANVFKDLFPEYDTDDIFREILNYDHNKS